MKSFKILILCSSLLVLDSCNQASKKATDTAPITGKQLYTDSASSSVKVFSQDGKVCIQQSNTYYEMILVKLDVKIK